MIANIYRNILKREKLVNLDLFINDYQTFEEIPLISRYAHLDFLLGTVRREDIQFYLINIATFLLNNIELYARNKLAPAEYKNYFVCVTFVDLDDIDSVGYSIPNFLVTRKKELLSFLGKGGRASSREIGFLALALEQCGLKSKFKFFKIVSRDDVNGDLVRIYAVDKVNIEKLGV